MIGRISLTAAMMFCLFELAGSEQPAGKTPNESTREVVYFGPAGPVRIRLHLAINGRSADAAWTDAINGLFAFRDKDNDGFLNASERAPLVGPTRGAREILQEGVYNIQPLRLTFSQKDEKINRAAFVEAVRAAGLGSIGMRVIPSSPESRQLSEALFRLLDQNGDGRLSQEELKAARERLAHLDIDEDEYITAVELLGRGADVNTGRIRPVTRGVRPTTDTANSSTELVFLTTDGNQAVKQLLAARGGARATSLKPAEFGSNAKKFTALDQDGNGVLDTTELTAWFLQPPDLDLAVAFDSASGRLSVLSSPAQASEKEGSVLAALPGGRFQFELPVGPPTKEWESSAERIRVQFKELAKEKGFVEKKQLENQPLLLVFFELADQNGDGKVDSKEIEAALKAIAPLARCRIDLALTDQGTGLFEVLDRNGDGRLSPRELVEAATALKPFTGPDGTIGPKDLVRQYQVRFSIEPIQVGMLIAPAAPMRTVDASRAANVPAWFTKMDRNRDGDVSLREFVGPIELFRKLDKNGDGLISLEEAIAAGN